MSAKASIITLAPLHEAFDAIVAVSAGECGGGVSIHHPISTDGLHRYGSREGSGITAAKGEGRCPLRRRHHPAFRVIFTRSRITSSTRSFRWPMIA